MTIACNRLDEQKAATEADAFLASVAREFGDEYATGEKSYEDLQRAREAGGGSSKKKAIAQPKNTSVYVTGLTTYIACKQLGTTPDCAMGYCAVAAGAVG